MTTKKLSIIIPVFLIVISCLLPLIFGDGSTDSGSVGQQSPKKIRFVGPAVSRIYHLLHNNAVNNGGEIEDLFADDENYVQKRQYDDYGHMRFGKRQSKGDFDDYGHLRFGK